MRMPENNTIDFENPPQGPQVAVCYRVIDLGTQEVTWSGETKLQHKIMLSFEYCDEVMEDGRPFTIHSRYTFSSSEKSNFRQHLEGWRGRAFTDSEISEFDPAKLIGQPALLNVMHRISGDKVFANVVAVSPVPKQMQAVVKPLTNEALVLSLDPLEFSQEVYEKLSNSLKETIAKSPEFSQIKVQNSAARSSNQEPQRFDEMNPPPADEPMVEDEVPFV